MKWQSRLFFIDHLLWIKISGQIMKKKIEIFKETNFIQQTFNFRQKTYHPKTFMQMRDFNERIKIEYENFRYLFNFEAHKNYKACSKLNHYWFNFRNCWKSVEITQKTCSVLAHEKRIARQKNHFSLKLERDDYWNT